jgi:competence protein ComEA
MRRFPGVGCSCSLCPPPLRLARKPLALANNWGFMMPYPARHATFCLLLLFVIPCFSADLQTFEQVRHVPTDWADGDSFLVEFPDGTQHTLRLYGADCLEWHVTDRTDARRLWDQRRYFGISKYGGSSATSIAFAKSMGKAGADAVNRLLAEPFKVHTAFADGGGDGKYQRIYAFVTTADGQDLATTLVQLGLARAFGVYRGSPDGQSRDDYREALKDIELVAASQRRGIWANTDWEVLSEQRSEVRKEKAEAALATDQVQAPPEQALDINTAARDELMRIPGIGEVYANAIVENRSYRSVDELLRVRGIGEKRLSKLRRWVEVQE